MEAPLAPSAERETDSAPGGRVALRANPDSEPKPPAALRHNAAHIRVHHAIPQGVAVSVLVATLAGAVLLSLSVGAVHLSPATVLLALVHPATLAPTDRLILLGIRLPRIAAAALVGAALSVAGLLFQGLFRNPLADPYVLGASGGSVLGAGIGIFFLSQASFLGFSAAGVLAFAGAVLTMTLVYALARRDGRTNSLTLLLAGFAISTVLSNSTYIFEMLDTSTGGGARLLASWLRGIISTPRWSEVALSALCFAVAFATCFVIARRLNTLALGDEHAQQLGLPVEATRIAVILIGSLLTALAVALGGLISFAGLIVPHIARLLFGADNQRLLPITALGGAIFLVLADTLARTILSPTEIPVGILMAVLGGPFFLYLLRRSRRSYAL